MAKDPTLRDFTSQKGRADGGGGGASSSCGGDAGDRREGAVLQVALVVAQLDGGLDVVPQGERLAVTEGALEVGEEALDRGRGRGHRCDMEEGENMFDSSRLIE